MSTTIPPSRGAGAAPAGRAAPVMLGEVRGIRLWHWPGRGPGTLILFTPPGAPTGPRNWWGQGLAARLGWETLVFAGHEPAWYPAEEMAGLLPAALAALSPGARLTYGLGMGGYGALKFGRALGAGATVALAPTYSIDPADMPGDPRARRRFDPQRHAGMAIRAEDLADLPIVLSDPFARQDHLHARRLAALPGVRAVDVRRGGAVLQNILVETGRIAPLLTAALQGDHVQAGGLVRQARHASPTLRKLVAEALEARGHGVWAAALRQPTSTVAKSPPAITPQQAASGAGARLAMQARRLRQRGAHGAEEEVLRRWLAIDPASAEARTTLAQCLQMLRRDKEALALLLEALRKGVRDQRLFTQLVRLLRRLGETTAALEVAEGAAAAAPGDAEALVQLGETQQWAGHAEAAEQAFRHALGAQPGHRRALVSLILMAPPGETTAAPYLAALLERLATGPAPQPDWLRTIDQLWRGARYEAAVRIAAAAWEAHPDAIAFPLRQGRILLAAGREDEAVAHLRAVVEARPELIEAWYALADTLLTLQRHAEGRDALLHGVATHPQDPVILARLAAFLLALQETEAAQRTAQQAIELDPAVEDGYLIVMSVLHRRERRGEAIALARAALEAMPGAGANVAQRLGRMLMEIGDAAGAADAYGRATEVAQVPRQAWLGLAESLQAAGRPADAEAALRRGLQARPEERALKTKLGDVLLDRGETDAARQVLAEAVSDAADSAAADIAMVDALLRQGRPREAFDLLAATVEREPGHVEAELRFGTMLLDEGRHDDAAALFTRITEAAPDLAAAWVGLADAERLRKRVKPALEAYRRAVAAGASAQVLRQLRFRLFGEYDG
ncbi:tetratricopeptide repeat protein [Roseomonas terrae]|uniref:Tetratricopeptide repeat protein n=1 Tax=Neoroseomonas terrae TaxID=424799 RepID=A0ABS5EFU5_9PROT|nr:tetratricopeptide repeat protein [Neoroseomonas terrae]MBR0649890.1 tetratricopeptide repeat protein [Neoroseomonas terrae]